MAERWAALFDAASPTVVAIEVFVAISFLVIGLSHVVQHRAWADFFVLLRSKGRPGAFVNGFLSLPMGTLIVAFHNVWSGFATVVTLIGWALVVKGAVNFVFPDYGLRSMARARPDNSKVLAYAGYVMIAFALVLGFTIVRAE